MKNYSLLILHYIHHYPFFNRFNNEQLARFLQNAQVKYYDRFELIFVDGKVGVIKEGSVHVKTHTLNLLSPHTIAKLGAGRILGHACDDGLTSGSEQWI